MNLFTELKEWGGQMVIIKPEPITNSLIIIAVHSNKFGPATGGTRMMQYANEELAIKDALKLSAAMTSKFIGADFPRGGGKAVIMVTKELTNDERLHLLKVYGLLINELNGIYYTGPDVGTSITDMDILSQYAEKFVFNTNKSQKEYGSSAMATALGVYLSMKTACRFLYNFSSLKGKTILIQGIGNVGVELVGLLKKDDATVLISDINISPSEVFKYNCPVIPVGDVYNTPCDIFSPCALGGILNKDTAERLDCRAIVGSANNQLENDSIADIFRERKILYAPDFLVNNGGAVCITGIEALGWTWDEAIQKLQKSSEVLFNVFAEANAKNISTQEAVSRIVKEKLEN